MRVRGMFIIAALVPLAACSSTRTVVVSPTPRGTTPPPPRPAVEQPPPRSTAATLGIPPGHLPQPGECRVWIPGTPPGQQPGSKSRACPGIAAEAPVGSWIVYRPTRDRKLVHVRVVDARRQGVVTVVRVFNVDGGWIKDLAPDDDEAKPDRNNNNNRGRERP